MCPAEQSFFQVLCLCAGLLMICHRVSAAEPAKNLLAELEAGLSGTVQLSDLLEYAYLTSPAVTASKKSWEAFIETYRVEKSLPDPQISATFFPRPIETRLVPRTGT